MDTTTDKLLRELKKAKDLRFVGTVLVFLNL